MFSVLFVALIAVLCFCVITLVVAIIIINRCYRQDGSARKKDFDDEELDRFIETDDELEKEKPLPSAHPLDDIFYFDEVDIAQQEPGSDELQSHDRRLESGHRLQEHVIKVTDIDAEASTSETIHIVEESSKASPSNTSHSVKIPVVARGESTDNESAHTADDVSSTPSSIPGRELSSGGESVTSDTSRGTGGLLLAAQKFQSIQQQHGASFSENANLKISFEHMASIKCFRGNIQSVDGLNIKAKDCPQEIGFHVTFIPSKRFRMVTKYKSISNVSNLGLTFTMGPVTAEDLSKNKLRVRLYGKKSRLTRSKCYGQCTFKLDQMIGKSGYSDFNANLLPIPSDTYVSSDSER